MTPLMRRVYFDCCNIAIHSLTVVIGPHLASLAKAVPDLFSKPVGGPTVYFEP